MRVLPNRYGVPSVGRRPERVKETFDLSLGEGLWYFKHVGFPDKRMSNFVSLV